MMYGHSLGALEATCYVAMGLQQLARNWKTFRLRLRQPLAPQLLWAAAIGSIGFGQILSLDATVVPGAKHVNLRGCPRSSSLAIAIVFLLVPWESQ